MRIFIAIFLTLMLPLSAAITERYVSSSGTDTYANSSNSATPMSLTTAFANAVANDRINIKADGTYTISSPGVTISAAGPIFWRGYTSTIGDGGKATISGSTTGASYSVITISGARHQWQDLIFTENGSTGDSLWMDITGARNVFIRCVWHDTRGTGIENTLIVIIGFIECEAYSCNEANKSGNNGGIHANTSGSVALRCYCHDNIGGTNGNGIIIDGGVLIHSLISESNTGNGYYSTGDTTATLLYSDIYNNSRSGLYSTNGTDMLMTSLNNNWINNTRYAVEFSSTTSMLGTWLNNAYGAGTEANDLGNIQAMEGMYEIDSINYLSNILPWVDAPNGNFIINLDASSESGRGLYLQILNSYSGTIGYPDIGAGQRNR